MPFRLRKAPNRPLYWVVDDKGKKYSKDPLPEARARAQQKALYAAEGRGELKGGMEPPGGGPSRQSREERQQLARDAELRALRAELRRLYALRERLRGTIEAAQTGVKPPPGGEPRGSGQFVSRLRNRNEPRAVDSRPRGTFAEAMRSDVTFDDPLPQSEEPQLPERTATKKTKSKKKEDPQKVKGGGDKQSPFARAILKQKTEIKLIQRLQDAIHSIDEKLAALPPQTGAFASPERNALMNQRTELINAYNEVAEKLENRSYRLEGMYEGYGKMKGGVLEKRSYETEEQYRDRLLRTEEKEQQLASKGITPKRREEAIASAAKLRRLKDIRSTLGQLETEAAFERDPETIAKREEIAQRERENAIFGPVLEGLIDVAKVGTKMPYVPSWLGKVGETVTDYLSGTREQERLREQQKMEEEAARQSYREARASDIATARREVGDATISDIDRMIADTERVRYGGARGCARFGCARYF